MNRTSFKIGTFIFYLLLSQSLLAQPGPAEMKYNFLFFKSDTGVFVNNVLWDYYSAETRATGPIQNANHYQAVSICKDNINKVHNASFYELQIQLLKGTDTMNVYVENVKMDSIHYAIRYLPFIAGDYHIQLQKDVPDFYKLIKPAMMGNRIIIGGSIFEAWDITPHDWNPDITRELPKNLNCDSLKGNWLLSSITTSDNKVFSLHQLINIDESCGYSFHLTVNSCTGKLFFLQKNSIQFSDPVCTEKCCDSELSRNVMYILTRMDKIISYTDDTLKINGIISTPIPLNDLSTPLLSGKVQMTLIKQNNH